MPAPRMVVGWFGRENRFRALLEAQGHDIVELSSPAAAVDCEALVIATSQAQIEGIVEALEPHIRRGQIVIHTSIGLGVQVLDPVEVHGALAMAIAHVGADRWVVTTSDELAQGIAEVLLFESAQVSMPKTDAERVELAPKIAYAQMVRQLARAAHRDLKELLDEQAVPSEQELGEFLAPRFEISDIYAAFQSITNPGFRKAFVEAARRVGELEHNMELEMWGLQEELR
ncbi:6PGD fold domain-containing protein [Corynebacterium stationis]|uniref:6PGD fold domain-containing protein n=1 Tax=Corynebacterium stationis TaxID=1705 RepID=UPI0009C3B99D|nr:hypothetical protein [Corynebacterium stationis]AQX71868.1 hypothetical protein CA21670_10805 [Corynebacterium stationis]